ncbi:hypothetical protein PVAG01_06229 [Phlyctema vagabunda]|uniref:Phosphatidylcholine-hydrolyzing phospholipase C n=1 Tax=Phlyctema vagabunda TaxID=108571 RepID=A0ABR4PFG7_9HELO
MGSIIEQVPLAAQKIPDGFKFLTPQPVPENNGSVYEFEPFDNLREDPSDDTSGQATLGSLKFESSEHEAVSQGVILKDIYGRETVAEVHEIYPVKTKPRSGGDEQIIPIKFGRIIALAGDHYSNAEDSNRTPICGAFFGEESDEKAKKRFISAVESLIYDKDHNLIALTDLLDKESHAVQVTAQAEDDVAQAFHSHTCGIPTDRQWFDSNKYANVPWASLYAWLSYINADHFGDDAVTAYRIGHELALGYARDAAGMSTDAEKSKGLNKAYLYEAFAAHFLTDLFSAGHLRAPRRLLHTTNYNLMIDSGLHTLIDGKETPTWDHHSRYMHDDDSATGLLVWNKKGDQWIAYGDKEFLATRNLVNRVRVINCLQASVTEVYEKGFLASTIPGKDSFAALSLLPRTMLAAKNAPWIVPSSDGERTIANSGYDKHNPAPLWLANNVKPGDNDWTCREYLDDHSDYSRVSGSPAPNGNQANDLCRKVQSGNFRGDDQYPTNLPARGLRSGGFFQIQDLDVDNGERTCVNVWSPAVVEVATRGNSGSKELIAKKQYDTFTLRNRIIDLIAQQQNDETLLQPLHWLKWSEGNKTTLVRFNWAKRTGSGTSEVQISKYQFTDGKPSEKGSSPSFDIGNSWKFTSSEVYKDVTLHGGLPEKYGPASLIRFLMGRFTSESRFQDPDIISFSFSENNAVSIAVCRAPSSTVRQVTTQTVDSNIEKGPFGFAKTFKTGGKKDDALLAKTSWIGGETVVDFCQLSFDNTGNATPLSSKFTFNTRRPVLGTSVLAGDVFNSGKHSAVVISSDFLKPEFRVFGPSDGVWKCQGKHKCTYKDQAPLMRPYFSALIPSVGGDSNPGLNIITLALHKEDNQNYLIFKLHRRSDEVQGEESQTWTGCRESERIPDDLAGNPVYFHIKWLRCRMNDNTNAIMEVYSFYGMLSMRVFNARDTKKPWAYMLAGQQPYLGQTSIGMGMGAYGDWGYGILTHGWNEDWVDINDWKPKSATEMEEGSWGLSAADGQRECIRGWEVRKRPF